MRRSEIKFQSVIENGRYCGLSQLSDGKIFTDDGCSFEVHKVILASHSDFFRAMFCGMDKDKREYTISKINGECFSEILKYIYAGDICVTVSNLKDLLIAADYLLMKDLYLKLKQHVENNITHANCLKLSHAAYELNEKDMYQRCFNFIEVRFEELIQNQKAELVDLPLEVLENILNSRNLNVESERTVWSVIIYWTEACVESRLNCVPNLLSTITIDEIGEDLLTDIISHDIVRNNPYINSLIDIEALKDFKNDCNLLLTFLLKITSGFPLKQLRIPENLNIISKYSEEIDGLGLGEIFISYDETLSLWRKITQVNFEPEYLITMGSSLYIFEKMRYRCVKFNLKTMELESMRNFRYYGQPVFAVENCIYSLYPNISGAYDIEVYNIDDGEWFPIPSSNKTYHASAVTIKKILFVIGIKSEMDGMIAQMFDPVTAQWIILSPPKIFRSHFELVPYHGKIYLLGGFNADSENLLEAEVYDPETDFWKELPPLPFRYSLVAVIVLNNLMIVYDFASMLGDGEPASTAVKWNDEDECWEKLENPILPKTIHQYRFCVVYDVETIKSQTKLNRNSKIKMEKSPFNCG